MSAPHAPGNCRSGMRIELRQFVGGDQARLFKGSFDITVRAFNQPVRKSTIELPGGIAVNWSEVINCDSQQSGMPWVGKYSAWPSRETHRGGI